MIHIEKYGSILSSAMTYRRRLLVNTHAIYALYVSPILIQLWFRDLLSALSYCHSNHIILRTMNLNQILIDESGIAKIGNLYRCHVLHPEERRYDHIQAHKTRKGSKEAVDAEDIRSNNYLAPELLFGSPKYTQKSDIWALGCLIAHVILDKILFFGKDRNSVAHAIIKVAGFPSSDVAKKFSDYPFFNSIISIVESSKIKKYKKNVIKAIRAIMNDRSQDAEDFNDILELLDLMLDLDPDKRISASEALEHDSMRNLSMYSSTPQFRQRFVHDWTLLKSQYGESMNKYTSSEMDIPDEFLSDDENDLLSKEDKKRKSKKQKDDVLDDFDIDDIITHSSSKRPRGV